MSKFNDIMIDIETLGAVPYSVILSIAAVEFDMRTGKTGREFYCIVDPESCQKHGLKIEANTVLWWLTQSIEARAEFTGSKSKLDITKALNQFNNFISKCEINVNLWANSPSFDCARIREACEITGLKVPWTYKQERDCRTIMARYPHAIPKNKKLVSHNALNDCYNQIERLVFVDDFIRRMK